MDQDDKVQRVTKRRSITPSPRLKGWYLRTLNCLMFREGLAVRAVQTAGFLAWVGLDSLVLLKESLGATEAPKEFSCAISSPTF